MCSVLFSTKTFKKQQKQSLSIVHLNVKDISGKCALHQAFKVDDANPEYVTNVLF